MRELKDLEKNPPEGIRVRSSEEDILDVTGIIEGPGEEPPFFFFWFGNETQRIRADRVLRRNSLCWRVFQGQVSVHERVSSCSSKMYVFLLRLG